MKRRGVLVTSSKKRPRSPAVKEEQEDDRLASQREWEELERQALAAKKRLAAAEHLQTDRSAQAYDDIDAEPETSKEVVVRPNHVKEEPIENEELDKDKPKASAPSAASTMAVKEEITENAEVRPQIAGEIPDISEEKRRRLFNAPQDSGTDANKDNHGKDKSKKARGGRKKHKEKTHKERKLKYATSKSKKPLSADRAKTVAEKEKQEREDVRKSERFRILEIEGYKKPRLADTTRLVVYTDFDAPKKVPGDGNFRSSILQGKV